MRVSMGINPNHTEGFSAKFPYNKNDVDNIRACMGFTFNKTRVAWESVGPEVLLDMARWGIRPELTPEARQVAEEFRQQVWDAMDIRSQPIDEELYGYQKYGSQFLAVMPNTILADEMGTGKSKQSLDAAALRNAHDILIVCPKTLCYNWLNEVKTWHPEWTVGVVPDNKQTTKREGIGREEFWQHPPQVVIVNYEKLLMADWPYDLTWDVLICDEATRLKNSKTVTYKNVKRIIRRTSATWALTGTPMETRLSELYSLLSLLRPAVLGNYKRFEDWHCQTDWAGNIVGVKRLELLRDRIGPFMLRRTKKEVLRQLPSKLPPINNFVKLSVPEQAAYQAMKSEFNNWLDAHGVSGGGNPLVEMLRMRQFCATPMLFTDELGRGSKYEALVEQIDSIEGMVVVFCYFKEVTQMLAKWLKIHPDAYIDGDVTTSLGERIRRAKDFSDGKLGKIFVSTDAGGQGINMPGAHTIIHYDQGNFNPAKLRQREDRLHRIGQTKEVQVINMLCMDTIDYGMYELNEERQHTNEEVVDGAEEALLRKLDAPRLKRLVEGRLNG